MNSIFIGKVQGFRGSGVQGSEVQSSNIRGSGPIDFGFWIADFGLSKAVAPIELVVDIVLVLDTV